MAKAPQPPGTPSHVFAQPIANGHRHPSPVPCLDHPPDRQLAPIGALRCSAATEATHTVRPKGSVPVIRKTGRYVVITDSLVGSTWNGSAEAR